MPGFDPPRIMVPALSGLQVTDPPPYHGPPPLWLWSPSAAAMRGLQGLHGSLLSRFAAAMRGLEGSEALSGPRSPPHALSNRQLEDHTIIRGGSGTWNLEPPHRRPYHHTGGVRHLKPGTYTVPPPRVPMPMADPVVACAP